MIQTVPLVAKTSKQLIEKGLVERIQSMTTRTRNKKVCTKPNYVATGMKLVTVDMDLNVNMLTAQRTYVKLSDILNIRHKFVALLNKLELVLTALAVLSAILQTEFPQRSFI
jgi:hypothetical protein